MEVMDKVKVKLAHLMGDDVREIEVVRGSTVRKVLNDEGMSTKNLDDIRINAELGSLDHVIDPPADELETIITIVPRVDSGM